MDTERGNTILNILGTSLRKARKSKKLSMRQLAALCTIDHSDIGKIEKGKKNITVLTLAELSDALEIKISTLIESL